MSDTSQFPRRMQSEWLVLGVTVLAIVLGVWYFMSTRQQALRSSPSGLNGLQIWLSDQELSALNFSGGWPIDQASVGLLVLPIYDSQFSQDSPRPESTEELLLQQDEFDQILTSIQMRMELVPSLVVLPKWRSGMRLTGLAHPFLLIEDNRIDHLLQAVIGVQDAQMVIGSVPFAEFDYRSAAGDRWSAQIYVPQLMRAEGCDPIIGTREAALLASCPLSGGRGADRVLILSDPDLINNHGLRLGDNARITADFFATEAGDQNIILDYSPVNWIRRMEHTVSRDRSFADLMRFFQPPFLWLWIVAGLTLTMFLWRSAVRFGPVAPGLTHLGASKDKAVEARARLLRLTNQDGALIAEYAAARLSATVARIFGPGLAHHYANEEAFMGYLQRTQPDLGWRLQQVLVALRALPAQASGGEAIRHIDEFEEILERLTGDTR